MENKFLNLPEQLGGNFSFGDFIAESVPNWQELNSVFVEQSVLESLKETSSHEFKEIKLGLWQVTWLVHGGKRHYFPNKPYGGKTVYISC